MSFDVPLCSWAADPDSEDEDSWKGVDKDADRTARIGQAGNCMHTQCVGLALLHALSSGNMPVKALDRIGMRGQVVPLHHPTGSPVNSVPPVQTQSLSHEHNFDLTAVDDENPSGNSQIVAATAGVNSSNQSTQPHQKPVTLVGHASGLSQCLGTMGLMIAQRSRKQSKKP